jgi:hypothetical protein
MKISRQNGNLKLGNVETYQVFSFKRFSPLEARGVRGFHQKQTQHLKPLAARVEGYLEAYGYVSVDE